MTKVKEELNINTTGHDYLSKFVLRKTRGHKVIKEYRTAYDAAEDVEMLVKCFGKDAEYVQQYLAKKCIFLCNAWF